MDTARVGMAASETVDLVRGLMMRSLFSGSWYRFKDLTPRLRQQAHLVRHVYRGKTWHVLQDMASGRFLRLDDVAYFLTVRLDGHHSVENLWMQAADRFGDDAPTQDEFLGLLAQLHQANVLSGSLPDAEELFERRRKSLRNRIRQYIGNPLSLKLPLFDPDRLLHACVRFLPQKAWRWLLVVWFGLVALGCWTAALNWDELTQDVSARVFTPDNLLLMWLAFPVLKGIHEFGHGLAIRLLGGRCHEMGLMFLLFIPVPYVDASSSVLFHDKRHRMLVGMAGMLIEMLVAAVAIVFWAEASTGMLKAFLYQLVVLASVTTVLFNANPLLRFDGYYVLADWLEIPDLATKANRYVGHLLQKHVFGARDSLVQPDLSPREPAILLVYCVASFIYRMFITAGICLFVATQYFFVGVLLAFWSLWGSLIQPAGRMLAHLLTAPALQDNRRRAIGLSLASLTTLILLLGWLPAPSSTHTEGVIWMTEQGRLRAPQSCFGHSVLVKPGETLPAGGAVLGCTDPELESKVAQAEHRVAELDSRLQLAATQDRAQFSVVQLELDYQRKNLEDLKQRRSEMVIRTAQAGVLAMDAPDDFSGRYAARGEVLAYIMDRSTFRLITVVPQTDVDLVRKRTARVEMRTADDVFQLLTARVVREVPSATRDLPSLALSLQGGGNIGMDPGAEPGQEPKALTSIFQFELDFGADAVPLRMGQRVYVRFVHEPEPLFAQAYRSVRQIFLKRFAL